MYCNVLLYFKGIEHDRILQKVYFKVYLYHEFFKQFHRGKFKIIIFSSKECLFYSRLPNIIVNTALYLGSEKSQKYVYTMK